MSYAKNWHQELQVEKTISALKEKGFETFYFSTKEDAVKKVLDIVPPDAKVGLGGSVTLRELGLPTILLSRGNTLADHWAARQQGASSEEMLRIRRTQLNSDVFITSTNAITETGELINRDGGGQRVASMIFGPKKVVIVAGINKIVRSIDEGLERIMNYVAPINAKRLNRKTPCVTTGVCSDCKSSDRICNVTSIIHGSLRNTPTTVILIGEKLGY